MEASTSSGDESVTLELKLSKSTLTYTLADLKLNTPVNAAKAQLEAQERSRSPPAADQKWLLKGKVLNDDKLLSDYFSSESPASVTIMLKPGAAPFPANTELPDPAPAPAPGGSFKFPSTETSAPQGISSTKGPSPSLSPSTGPAAGGRSHMRVPSLTLNTSNTELDPAQQQPATSHRRSPSLSTQFQTQVTDPVFWEDVHKLLVSKFGEGEASEAAVDRLWETWFGASKPWMTPNEVALIRDRLGLHSMGGM